LAGETELLGENLPQCSFVHHDPHMFCPDANPGSRGGRPATNLLSYDTTYRGVKMTTHFVPRLRMVELYFHYHVRHVEMMLE
jgi:hypothetical protein